MPAQYRIPPEQCWIPLNPALARIIPCLSDIGCCRILPVGSIVLRHELRHGGHGKHPKAWGRLAGRDLQGR